MRHRIGVKTFSCSFTFDAPTFLSPRELRGRNHLKYQPGQVGFERTSKGAPSPDPKQSDRNFFSPAGNFSADGPANQKDTKRQGKTPGKRCAIHNS